MNWFINKFASREQVKERYRDLCKIHHPDKGGFTEVMQAINAEYAIASDQAVRREKPDWQEGQYEEEAIISERIRAAMEKIIKLKGIEIEVCGLWIWVGGDTHPVRESLGNAGYRWSKGKKKWYFPGVASRNHQPFSMNQIRMRYGSKIIKEREETEYAVAS